jgi:serine/threonine kinase PknH
VDEVVFGRYILLSLIGEGGMGKVYRAHDTVIGRDVAIKLLPDELGADPAYRERFRREANTVARLTEPHIIPIYDTGVIDGQLYLVMPIIEGTDIQNLLDRDGPMDPDRAVHIVEQLAAALSAAHAAGLVHRDVKPSNALLTGQDFVYLIDFGVARGSATTTRLTSVGMFMGTLAYMAPERFSDGVTDARSDIYALACLLHECLTNTTPYPGDSMEQQITGHLTVDPPRPSDHRVGLPVGFDDVIATGMAKNPDQRYATTIELANAARAALGTTPSGPIPKAPDLGAAATRMRPIPVAPQKVSPTRKPMPPPTAKPPTPTPAPPTPPPHDAPTPEPVPHPRPRTRPVPVVAGVAVAVVAVGVFAYLFRPTSHAPEPAITPSVAPASPTVSAVAETALQGLLLNATQLDTATGATGMAATRTLTTLPDGSSQVPDKTCVPLEGPGQATVYNGSGFTAVSGQRATDQTHTHLVEQIVVLFPSAQDAQAFYAASTQHWPDCANRQYDETTPAGQTGAHTAGPVSNSNGTLSATITGIVARNGSTGACERALTVANNVAIDVAACGENPAGAAVNVAGQIAANVPGPH